MKNKSYLFIGSAALLVAFFLLGIKFYKKSQNEQSTFMAQNDFEVFVRDHSPRLGNKDAKVYLVEFLDPECESCRRFYPIVKELLKKYQNKVQLVVRYAAFHGNSKIAIAAVESSKKQNKYWESLELLFQTQPEWGSHHNPQIDLIYQFLPKVGVDIAKLRKDMQDPAIQDLINQDMNDLRALGVRGTPTFFVNGKRPEDYSFQALETLLAQEIELQYP